MKNRSIKDKVEKLITKTTKILKGEKSLNKNYSNSHTYSTEAKARLIFEKQKEPFLNVNKWDLLSGPENASFKLYDQNGNKASSDKVNKGDFIWIDLPGPLPIYWVSVENVNIENDSVEIILRPSEDPTDKSKEKSTKHFFKSQALNILKFKRQGNTLYAEEVGREEAINNNTEESGAHATLNTIVASGGWAGIQAHQWNTFTKNLVNPDIKSK